MDEEAPFPLWRDSLQRRGRQTDAHPCASLLPAEWAATFSQAGTKQNSTGRYLISDIVSARGEKVLSDFITGHAIIGVSQTNQTKPMTQGNLPSVVLRLIPASDVRM